MTLPAAPLPRCGDLLRALTASEDAQKPWTNDHANQLTRVYRRGSLALAAGIEAARRAANAATVTVWVPGYFCNEALEPARRSLAKLRFYPVREDLAPDFEKLNDWARAEQGLHVLVLVHYFGFANATSEARTFCDLHGMVLIEDSAHMLRTGPGTGLGDLKVLSPRKILAVPFGGLLVGTSKLVTLVDVPVGNNDWLTTIGWITRRVTQKFLVKLRFPWHRFMNYQEAPSHTEPAYEKPDKHGEGCNSYALKLLSVTARDLDEVVKRRRSNYVRLLDWSSALVGVRPLFPHMPEGICPYAFPLLVQGGCKSVVAKLQASGVMASRWPDLPPELFAAEKEHRVAIDTYEQLLLLPIHQSLSLRQIDIAGRRLRQALTTVS